jgi:hypothetical protein
VHATWELNLDETELLVEICRQLDVVEALAAVLDANGVMTLGSKGQPVVHGAVAALTSARALLGRQLAQLGLPDPQGESVDSPRTAQARRAAQARWANHPRRGRATA